MLSAARAGASACAARVCRCPVSATRLVKHTAAATVSSWPSPSSSAASTTAAASFPASFATSSRRSSRTHTQLRAAFSDSYGGFINPKLLPALTFTDCVLEVLHCAAPSTTPEQRKAAISKLDACRERIAEWDGQNRDTWWMLVECGTWAAGAAPPAGPAGTPALAVLCFAPARGAREFDAHAFVLGSDGLPTGDQYVDPRGRASVTAFEQRTSKKAQKKYKASCAVILNGQRAWVSARGRLLVEHFLVEKFGYMSVHRKGPDAPGAGGAAGQAAGGGAAGQAAAGPAAGGGGAGAAGGGAAGGAGGAGSSRRRRQRKPNDGGAPAA